MEAWQGVVSLLFCFMMQSREGIGSTTVCGEDGSQIRPLWTADTTENEQHAIGRCAGTRSRRVHQDYQDGGCCQMFRQMRDARPSSWQRVSVSNRKISSLHIYTHYPHLSELSAYQIGFVNATATPIAADSIPVSPSIGPPFPAIQSSPPFIVPDDLQPPRSLSRKQTLSQNQR